MFFSPWNFDFEWGKMDGGLDFQADGAAHHQARSQAEAGDKKPRSRNMRYFIAQSGGKVKDKREFANVRRSTFDVRSWEKRRP